MAGVVFSELSGKNDSLFKAVEGVLTEIIQDTDTGKTKEDEVLESIFNVKKSKKFGERGGGMTEFANFDIITEGGVAPKDELEEGFGKLITFDEFSKSFTTTRKMAADEQIDSAKTAAKAFVKAYKRSKLQFATDYLVTEGATFTYGGKSRDKTTGDGEGLFATAHKGKRAGLATQSNVFTNAFGNDASMLMHLASVGRNFKNESGVIQGYTFNKIVIPGNCWRLEELVKRIINSSQVVGSANNDVNTQKNRWTLVVDHLWEATSGSEPYILISDDANEDLQGLMFYNREALDVRNEIDLHTRNLEWNGYCRFGVGAYNWRACILGGAASGTTLT